MNKTKTFEQWCEEKKKLLAEENYDNSGLITRIDMALQVYFLYVKEMPHDGLE